MAKGSSKGANKKPSSSFPSTSTSKPSIPKSPQLSTSTSPASPFDPRSTSPISPFPFHPPSPTLLPFLSTLPRGPIYILHLDSFPTAHKKQIFLVPLLLNTTLALLLLWRASVALPAYISILAATLGLESRAAVNVSNTPWRALLALGARRAGMFFVDFALVRVVAGWPIGFFWGAEGGELGPLRWRFEVGFGEREVVVRRSRGWWGGGEENGKGKGKGEVGERLGRERERVLPVVETGWVSARTGYAMMDRNWELYFTGMVDAHRLMGKGEVPWENFERKVVVWTEEGGWLVWEAGRLEGGEEGRGGEGKGGRAQPL